MSQPDSAARAALLAMQESFADVAATVAGFRKQFTEQGFTEEQAAELVAAFITRAMREGQ